MIQRIQSIYLLLAAILMAVTAFSPVLVLNNEGLTLFSYGIKDADLMVKPTWGIVIIAGAGALLSFVSIFMYRNRKRQGKMVLLSALFFVLYYLTAIIYLGSYFGGFPEGGISTAAYGIVLPVIALIFLLLGYNAIRKDEKLVKSLDRIR